MVVTRAQTICASVEVRCVVYRPVVAILIAFDIRGQILVFNGLTERPTGFSAKTVSSELAIVVEGESYEVKQGVLIILLLPGTPNKQYETA